MVKTEEQVGRALAYCKAGRGGSAVGKSVRPASGRLGVRIKTSDRPKSLTQVVTVPLPNVRQYV